MTQFIYEIVQPIAVLSDSGTNTAELNIISFNGSTPKYDLRRWGVRDGEKTMQKGIALSKEEVVALRNVLNDLTDI